MNVDQVNNYYPVPSVCDGFVPYPPSASRRAKARRRDSNRTDLVLSFRDALRRSEFAERGCIPPAEANEWRRPIWARRALAKLGNERGR